MLRWPGDYTLPRFRAKLANKYLLHPDVEPGYAEVYKAELNARVIEHHHDRLSSSVPDLRREQQPGRFNAMDAAQLRWMEQTRGRLAHSRPSEPLSAPQGRTAIIESLEIGATPGGPKRRAKTLRREIELLEEAQEIKRLSCEVPSHLDINSRIRTPGVGILPDSMMIDGESSSHWMPSKTLPTLRRSISVPSVTMDRSKVAPASLRPLPDPEDLDGEPPPLYGRQRSGGQLAGPASPTSPKEAVDTKEREREMQAKAISQRLWMAAAGSDRIIKEWLSAWMTEGGDQEVNPTTVGKCDVPGITEWLNKGAKLDWQRDDWDGATLLIKAVRAGQFELALYLIDKGADPTIRDKSGRGIMHWAAIEGHCALLSQMMKDPRSAAASISAPDSGGDCPIHLAAYNGHLEVVRALVCHGANATVPNDAGFTPLQLAESRRWWHVARYLRQANAQDDDKKNSNIKTRTLMRACNLDHADHLVAEGLTVAKPKAKKDDKGGKKK